MADIAVVSTVTDTHTDYETTKSTTASARHHPLAWLKVGVAVAIVKNKPASLSARQYAEKLGIQFISAQLLLREKHQRDHAQLKEIKSQFNRQSQPEAEGNLRLSTDNLDPDQGNAENKMTPPPSGDYGKDICYLNEERSSSENPDIANRPHVLSPCGSPRGQWVMSGQSQYTQLTQAVQALSALASGHLDSKTETPRIVNLCSTNVKAMTAVVTTGQLRVSTQCLREGARAIVLSLKQYPWLEHTGSVMMDICSLLDTVFYILRHKPNQSLNYHHQQQLSHMLTEFLHDQDFPLIPTILEYLAEGIESYCHSLRQSHLTLEAPDPDMYERGFFPLHCLEATLQIWSQRPLLCSDHLRQLLEQVQRRLESAVLLLFQPFPLLVQIVWKITALIEDLIHQSLNSSNQTLVG